MKERRPNTIGQKAKEDAIINFVSYQAQEAILNPNIEDAYKDWIVNAAVRTINKIAERRNTYTTGEKHYGKRKTRSTGNN